MVVEAGERTGGRQTREETSKAGSSRRYACAFADPEVPLQRQESGAKTHVVLVPGFSGEQALAPFKG